MNTNQAFLGSKLWNPFHFQKFSLLSMKLYLIRYLIAGTLLATDNDKKLYLNCLEAMAFSHHGHGIPFNHFSYQYFMVLDLTSSQQVLIYYLYPQLTNAPLSVELPFSTALTENTDFFPERKRINHLHRISSRSFNKHIPEYQN